MPKRILIEGWRFIPHSYACVNMWQCLDLLKRDEVDLYHHDMPYYQTHWKPSYGLFGTSATAALDSIPSLSSGSAPDLLFRIDYPYCFTPVSARQHFVFGTTEHGMVTPSMLAGGKSLAEAMAGSEAVIVTPSNWSRAGFLRSGAAPQRVVVVPHGVDTDLFRPLPEEDRVALRKQMGWHDSFVFLNIGAMTGNKGVRYLLKAFVVLQQRFPQIKLCLKGLDPLYPSLKLLGESADLLNDEEIARLQSSLVYIGKNLSFPDMANIYNACDAYVSPYVAEGFNLPVLEAAACGLPVICTKGGPTDDFVDPIFARKIESTLMQDEHGMLGVKPDLDHLITLMSEVVESGGFRQEKRAETSSFVADAFTWRHAVDKLLAAFSAN